MTHEDGGTGNLDAVSDIYSTPAEHAAVPHRPTADVANPPGSRHKGTVPDELRTAKEIFTAYQAEPPRRKLPIWTAALVLFAIGMVFALRSESSQYRVVTPRGIKAVSPGMSQGEFGQLLGEPVAREPGNGDCFRYGTLTLEKDFVLYTACFENGKLRDVTPRLYTADSVAP